VSTVTIVFSLIAFCAQSLYGQRAAVEMAPLPDPEESLTTAERQDPAKVEAAWRAAYQRRTDLTLLRQRILSYRTYCADAKAGLWLGQPSYWVTPRGQQVAVFSHPTFARPLRVKRDAEGNVISVQGGDRVLVMPRTLADRLAGKLCVPPIGGRRRDRRFVRAFLADDRLAGRVRLLRRIPSSWRPVEVTQQ